MLCQVQYAFLCFGNVLDFYLAVIQIFFLIFSSALRYANIHLISYDLLEVKGKEKLLQTFSCAFVYNQQINGC